MSDPTEFCPTLPEPYEELVKEALWAYGQHGFNVGGPREGQLNHAAAEAEHALRVALLALVTR